MKIWATIMLLFFVQKIIGAESKYPSLSKISLSVGNLTRFVGQIQKNENGDKQYFDFNPYFAAMYPIPFAPSFTMYAQTGFVFPMKAKDEANSRKEIYFIGADAAYFFKNFLIKLGAGTFISRVGGDGGTEALPNGPGGQTTNFFLPAEKRTAINFSWDVGLEYFITKHITLNAILYLDTIADSDSRTASYLFGINYHFGSKSIPQTGLPSSDQKDWAIPDYDSKESDKNGEAKEDAS